MTSIPLDARATTRFDTARLVRWLPLVWAIVAAECVVLAIEPWPVGVFQDDGIYTVLAKALATGQGYRFLQMPGEPLATHYPPGYPLLLAALWKLYPSFPQNVTLFKFVNAALIGLAAWGAWHLATTRARLGAAAASAVTLLFTASVPVILLSVMVMSEPLFLALLLPTLVLSERAAESGRTRDVVWAVLAVGALCMVRTLGALLFPALVLTLAWRRHWRLAAMAVVLGALTLLPWQLWVSRHAGDVPAIFLGKYGSYTGWLTDAMRSEGPGWVLRVAKQNLVALQFETWTHTGTVLLSGWLRYPATIGVAMLYLAGLVAALRRVPVVALFVAAYTVVVIIWPFPPARFLWGIWPVMGLVAVLGAVTLMNLPQRLAANAARVVVALLLFGYGRFTWQSVSERWWSATQAAYAKRSAHVVDWVRANTAPGAVLATDDDVLIHLYTGRQTVPNGTFTPQEHLVPQTRAFATERLGDIVDQFAVDYVVATSDYGVYAATGLMRTNPPRLRLVQTLEQGAVFAPVDTGAAR